MMTLNEWNIKVTMFKDKITKLYLSGNLNLKKLNDFRDIIDDMNYMMTSLFSDIRYTLGSFKIRKEIQELSNEYLILEYNLSLISSIVA